MSTTPRPRKEPQRSDAPGRARTPASTNPCLSGSLSAYSNGPASIVSMPRSEKSRRIDFLSHSWTTTSSVTGATSATRACPVSRRSMASSTTFAASVSAGDSSVRRSHNSSMLACRSAMPHLSQHPRSGVPVLGESRRRGHEEHSRRGRDLGPVPCPLGDEKALPFGERNRATAGPVVMVQMEHGGARHDEDELGAAGGRFPPGPRRLVTEDGHDPPLLQFPGRLAMGPKVLVDRHGGGRLVGGEVEHRVIVEREGGGTRH